jgi:hypothetical protein
VNANKNSKLAQRILALGEITSLGLAFIGSHLSQMIFHAIFGEL